MLGADNQQETSKLFYYTGFCIGELSCSLLRLSNRKSKNRGVYYTPDITISNADLILLNELNLKLTNNYGVITKIKGGFNLSFRGKKKVKKVLTFFSKYPPVVGDLAQSKIFVINKAISILESQKNYRRTNRTQKQLEECREIFKEMKKTAVPYKIFSQRKLRPEAIGYFLSGVWDAEGSAGIKKSGDRWQPYVAVAMKDQKIIRLFQDFFNLGHIHIRSSEKIYHWESGSRQAVLKVIEIFSNNYSSKLLKMRLRMNKVRRILNDYTPRSNVLLDMI